MKKLFTLALGMVAAMTASAQTITVKCDGKEIENGATYTTYMHTGIEQVDLSEFGMGIVDAPYWLIDPETEIVSTETGILRINATLTEAKNGKCPQMCWGNPDINNAEGLGQCSQMVLNVTETRYGKAEAGVAVNPAIDYAKVTGGILNPGYVEPAEGDIHNTIKVEIATADNNVLFTYNLIFTSEKNAGVENVTVDNNAPREYFDLQGRRVANPANGLYIVRQGDKVTKEYIR